MPKKKYIVSLTSPERNFLEQLTKKGKIAAQLVKETQNPIPREPGQLERYDYQY